jgi:hypothetical protein
MGKITVKSFDSLDDAKKHLEAMKKKGHNGLISKGGKPVKEENVEEARKSYDDKEMRKKLKTPKHATRATAGAEKKEREAAQRKKLGLEQVEIEEHCGECEESIEEKMDGRKKNSGKQAKKDNEDRRASQRKKLGILGPNEETIGEKKGSDYELYHKTFSAAMQHAYAVAKKRGYTVDNDDIDNQVAFGMKKPSKGKTNRYILGTDKKQNLHVQVANLDNKQYELNMYIEETEKENMNLDETIKQVMEGKKKWQKTGLANAEDDPVASKNSRPMKKEDSDKGEPGTQGDDKEYQAKRDKILKKYGVKSCAMCATEEEKKACFNELDKAHVGDHEESTKKEAADEPGASPDDVAKKMKKAKEPQAEGYGSGKGKVRTVYKKNETLLDKVKNIMKEKKYKK